MEGGGRHIREAAAWVHTDCLAITAISLNLTARLRPSDAAALQPAGLQRGCCQLGQQYDVWQYVLFAGSKVTDMAAAVARLAAAQFSRQPRRCGRRAHTHGNAEKKHESPPALCR